jgi:hypothetical protein
MKGWVLPLLAALVGAWFSAAACLLQAQDARQIAEEWAAKRIDVIADTIAQNATSETPTLSALASVVIKSQIQQRVFWSYSSAIETGEQRYAITASATLPVEINVLLVRRTYDLSASFDLTVDTKARKVIDWTLNKEAFSFTLR